MSSIPHLKACASTVGTASCLALTVNGKRH